MISLEDFREFLVSRGFHYDDRVLRLFVAKLGTDRRAFLLRGPAGVGKSSLAQLLAEYLGAELVVYQCTLGTGEDELLYRYVPSEETRSGIEITLGPLPYALEKSREGMVVLLIDEFDKTRPSADALLLDLLQNFRLALHLREGRRVVEGDPRNLVVILTSNDEREFSEPLLRRLMVINIPHITPDKVYRALWSRFGRGDLALLLTQIYVDTVEAGLRKPATIQELVEVGELLLRNPSADLGSLVRSIVVKYDDDWEKYLDHVRYRTPYSFAAPQTRDGGIDLAKYYRPEGDVEPPTDIRPEEAVKTLPSEVLDMLKRYSVKPLDPPEIIGEEYAGREEVSMKIRDKDMEGYTRLVKLFRPPATDDPRILGDYELVLERGVPHIIRRSPLRLWEVEKLVREGVKGEYYVEDEVTLPREAFDQLLESATKIAYYTKSRIFIYSSGAGGDELRLAIEDPSEEGGDVRLRIKMYLKYVSDPPATYRILVGGSLGEEADAENTREEAL